MGVMKLFVSSAALPARLPKGSFTVDRTGRILAGTVPSSVPAATLRAIGQQVLDTFREAQDAQLPLSELIVNYGSLKITARELRGGAIIFLSPKSLVSTAK
jgi:hypothetical protein